MLKKYSSRSCVSVSVRLSTGSSTHLSFTPRTGGGSVFYTDNEKLQEGLEKHPKFGKLFKLEEVIEDKKPKKGASPAGKAAGTEAGLGENAQEVHGESGQEVDGAESGQVQGDGSPTGETAGTAADAQGDDADTGTDDAVDGDEDEAQGGTTLKEVTVTCNDDAKDYLAEHFGVSRTVLRNRAIMDSTAEANGVKFIWK